MKNLSDMRALLSENLKFLGLDIDQKDQVRLLQFQEELLRWNKKINLTAVSDYYESLEKNLTDALTPLPWLNHNVRILDLGSGAGLPGLPLAIVRPDLQVVSVDAVHKKIQFQRHVARILSLKNFTAYQGRIEDPLQLLSQESLFDIVIARALADLIQLQQWAAPYLKSEGTLLAMKGPREGEGSKATEQEQQEKSSEFKLQRNEHFSLPNSGARRHLLIFKKTGLRSSQ